MIFKNGSSMKILVLIFCLLSWHVLFAEESVQYSSLKGINAFTVWSQISPHLLHRSFESALEKELGHVGKILNLHTDEMFEKNFFTAASNPYFLKMSLENRIVETGEKQLKIQTHIVLRCTKGAAEGSEIENLWIAEDCLDFSTNQKSFVDQAVKIVQNLAKLFAKTYHEDNTTSGNKLTFFIL